MIPTPGVTEVKVTNLEVSFKSKSFCFYIYIAISSRPFVKFYYPLIERLSGYSYQQAIFLSVHPSIEALFVHTLFLSKGQSFYVEVYKTLYYEEPLMDLIHVWPDGRYRA